MIFNKRDEYGWPALALHWLLFLILAGLLASGKYSDSLLSTDKIGILIDGHKQVGMAAFVLMAFRLLWRMINASVVASETFLIRLFAFCTHWLLYLVVMAQAAIGATMSQLAGRDVHFFGVFKLPSFKQEAADFLEKISELAPYFSESGVSAARQMRDLHSFVGDALIALIILHIAAALVHHFIFGDEVLRRIFFGYKPSYANKAYVKKTGARR